MSSISELRKKSESRLEDLRKAVNNKKSDDRFWSPTVDAAGNGSAIIRFLPEPKGEDFPWVKMVTHGFKNEQNQWYINNSLLTLGRPDPVSELINRLYNTGIEDDKKVAGAIKRKIGFISNILIIKDAKNPENEGKVFLFRYGKKIFDKLNLAMNPQFEDDVAFNPFDFWKGANFRLKIRQVDGNRNYDESKFDEPSELFSGDDAKLDAVWKAQHSLKAFHAEENFKSYEALAEELVKILGPEIGSGVPVLSKPAATSTRTERQAARVEQPAETPAVRQPSNRPAPSAVTVTPPPAVDDAPPAGMEADDDMEFFRSLTK